MAGYVERYVDKKADELEKEVRRVYGQAAKEVQKKLDSFIAGYRSRNVEMLQMVKDGKISEQDYQKWLGGQIFQGKQWRQKLKDVTTVYMNADSKARELVGKTSKSVFVESANYTAYSIEKDLQGAVSFSLYDTKTVEKLLKDDPKMLPEWKINEKKDYVWNEKRVQNAVAQGIIQGESIAEIGNRLTSELAASNSSKMNMFARTAVTGAQNAGRMERLHETEEMGIEVKKQWLATLDKRTRDTHQELDGQERPIDEPFEVNGMQIDYPGDPNAPPELVYNCRCTLVYVYPKFKGSQNAQRREQTTTEGERSGKVIEDLTYNQWRTGKKEKPETKAEEKEPPTVATPTKPKETKPKETKPKEVKYTEAEKDSVEWYVSGDGQWINQYLRGSSDFGELSEYEKEQLDAITKATEKKTVDDKVLYRAVDAQAVFGKMSDIDFENLKSAVIYDDKSKSAQAMLNNAQSKIGKEITEKGFMSTTRDPEIAYSWDGYTGSTKDIVLELHLPDGIHGFDVEKMFEVSEEQQREVLLERNLTYKVEKVEKRTSEDGTVIVVIAEIIKKRR